MIQKSAHLLPFVLAGLALLGVEGARAQQQQNPVKDSRDDSKVICRTPVMVMGAVVAPGQFVLQRRVRLIEVLAAAGGLSERAGKTVEIKRARLSMDCMSIAPNFLNQPPGNVEVYELGDLLQDDRKADPEVQPGDYVIVSETGAAYVYGSVVQPRAILLKERTTVTQAIKTVGGVVPSAVTNRVRVMRGCDPLRTIVVDLKAIEQGRATDLVIQPYDIVFVPGMRVFVGTPLCLRLIPQPLGLPPRVIN